MKILDLEDGSIHQRHHDQVTYNLFLSTNLFLQQIILKTWDIDQRQLSRFHKRHTHVRYFFLFLDQATARTIFLGFFTWN